LEQNYFIGLGACCHLPKSFLPAPNKMTNLFSHLILLLKESHYEFNPKFWNIRTLLGRKINFFLLFNNTFSKIFLIKIFGWQIANPI